MDYKKEYIEALERARQVHATNVDENKKSTEYIFPELKESNDEKIRKWLLNFVQGLPDEGLDFHFYNLNKEQVLAWLEKQGEQKPATNIEPKFEPGDWVVCEVTGSVYQIKNVSKTSNNRYRYDLANGDYIVGDEVNHYHRWTIEEAKTGDVLVSGFVIFVFNYIHEDKLNCKCAVHKDGSVMTEPYDLMKSIFFSEVSPSTKEQRDTLFAKMKEAGYEWDEDEKEFIKLTEPR